MVILKTELVRLGRQGRDPPKLQKPAHVALRFGLYREALWLSPILLTSSVTFDKSLPFCGFIFS